MKEFYDSFKQSRWFPLVLGILSLVFGVICLLNPQAKMEGIALYLGVIILVYGLVHILAGILTKNNQKLRIMRFAVGIISIVLAILAFANLSLIGKYLPTVVGFYMILCAIADLFHSVVLLKSGLKSWWVGALPAVIVLVLGFVFLLMPGYVGQTFGIFAGVGLLISGISNLIGFVQFKND